MRCVRGGIKLSPDYNDEHTSCIYTINSYMFGKYSDLRIYAILVDPCRRAVDYTRVYSAAKRKNRMKMGAPSC